MNARMQQRGNRETIVASKLMLTIQPPAKMLPASTCPTETGVHGARPLSNPGLQSSGGAASNEQPTSRAHPAQHMHAPLLRQDICSAMQGRCSGEQQSAIVSVNRLYGLFIWHTSWSCNSSVPFQLSSRLGLAGAGSRGGTAASQTYASAASSASSSAVQLGKRQIASHSCCNDLLSAVASRCWLACKTGTRMHHERSQARIQVLASQGVRTVTKKTGDDTVMNINKRIKTTATVDTRSLLTCAPFSPYQC